MATENSDFYGSDSSQTPPAESPDGAAPPAEETQDSEGGEQTALLDKAILGGKECKVGDVFPVRVVSIHENEIEVEKDDGSDTATKPESSMAASEGALDRLAKPPAEA